MRAAWGKESLVWGLAWGVIAIGGATGLVQRDLGGHRDRFETDARIVHRVLSQRVVQHDAILATLALLQPAAEGGAGPETRLPALYPQVLRVLRKAGPGPWSGVGLGPAEAHALEAAEEASRGAARAALGPQDFARGHYWLVRAASPSSYALLIDLAALPPPAEWPLAPDAAVEVWLAFAGQRFTLHDGRAARESERPAHGSGPGGHPLAFAKALAAESQPFEVHVAKRIGWAQWPWGVISVWCAASALVLAGAAAWLHQRAEQRRTRELLRLGQIGRLNALGELAAGFAHELNQPLTAVLANTAAAARMLADEGSEALPQASAAMAQATQQARRAADVLARLRRLIEPAVAGAAPQPVRLAALLESALDLQQPELRRAQVQVSSSCEPPDLQVAADPVALEQVVHNLIGNALQALQQVPAGERRLELVARGAGARGVLTVQDSGPGIAPEALPRLFEPFFTTREGGLGLGLSLCETLVTGMGGSLSGGNIEGGRGALFSLALPLAGAESHHAGT